MNCKLIALLVALLFPACVEPEPEPEWVPAFEPFDATDPAWSRTRRVLLVADCQLFNLYTHPLPERNLSNEAVVETAIRPPQLNMFAGDVMEFVLADDHGAKAILHLGDALDIACENEMREFVDLMQAQDLPWLVSPGNHDCVYFGNYIPIKHEIWEEACYGGGQVMTKDRWVRWYVAALLKQRGPGYDGLAESLGLTADRDMDLGELAQRIPLQFEFEARTDEYHFLDAISWNVDEEHPWRSFVVQRADLTNEGSPSLRQLVLMMDTAQYEFAPVFIVNAWIGWPLQHNAGLTGEMLPDQLRILRGWLDQAAEQNGDVSTTLASHHPFSALSAKTQASLRFLWREYDPMPGMMISAHTHRGFIEYHLIEEGLERLELNIGSTTDWPMEWRTLEALWHGEGNDALVYMSSPRYTLAAQLRNRPGHFEPGWEIPLGARDDYRQYKTGRSAVGTFKDYLFGHHWRPPLLGPPNVKAREPSRETEARVKDTMLLTYGRLIVGFPTDVGEGETRWPAGAASDAEVDELIESHFGEGISLDQKIALLQQLQPFEASRHTRDPDTGEDTDRLRFQYKLSQAVWASRFESGGGRRVGSDDELMRWRPGTGME